MWINSWHPAKVPYFLPALTPWWLDQDWSSHLFLLSHCNWTFSGHLIKEYNHAHTKCCDICHVYYLYLIPFIKCNKHTTETMILSCFCPYLMTEKIKSIDNIIKRLCYYFKLEWMYVVVHGILQSLFCIPNKVFNSLK